MNEIIHGAMCVIEGRCLSGEQHSTITDLKQQRDELKETLDVAIAAAQKAEKELIECMRQRDELLAALEFYTNPNVYEPDSIGRRDDITFVARAAIAKVKP